MSPSSRARQAGAHVSTHLDAVTFLTAYLVALFAIESRLVIGPLGGVGNPAQLIALVGLGWWIYYQVQRPEPTAAAVQPVRIALLVFFCSVAASYVVAMTRPIDPAESSTANLGMVTLLTWLGVALLANDGVPSRARFELLLGRLVLAATALALLGLAQFVVHDSLIRHFQIPGLVANIPLGDLQSRSGFTRPSGTALHPIEFGAVLTTVLPIAIARARQQAGRTLFRAWFPVAAIGLGIVVSSSRSALLCALVGLAVLGVVWSTQTRLMTAAGVLVLLAVVALTIPGMLGSLLKLFTRIGNDGSVGSRTGSYTIVGEFFAREPLFGRGLSTFLPSYRILDNQYLLLLLEVGLVGLLSFLGLLVAGCACATMARRHSTDAYTREQAQAFLAALISAAVGLGTYDGLSFPMSTGILFLVLGLAGALWRLVRTTGRSASMVNQATG